MSDKQFGIQAAHCLAEMFGKWAQPNTVFFFEKDISTASMLYQWGKNDKTLVLLKGGNCAHLADIFDILDNNENPYPYASFNEDKESLNEALTCVGIVVPEKIYDAVYDPYDTNGGEAFCQHAFTNKLTPFEVELCKLINPAWTA